MDGGLPLPVPDGVDLDARAGREPGPGAGPAARDLPQRRTAYFDFWRAHPALKDAWNADIEDYLRYDLTGPDGAFALTGG